MTTINEQYTERDRAIYKAMINEGWPQEEVAAMIATRNHVRLDEVYASLMADPERRARDVEIITPDRMVDGIIDLNAAKIQAKSDRVQKELDAEEAHWERTRDQLIAVMEASMETDYGLISATLNALLEVLTDDIDLEEAKKKIAMCLNAFGDASVSSGTSR